MNTVLSKSKNGQIKLFIDQPGVAPDERLVVALAELHEGLGAWNVMDIRLSQYGVVSRYFNVGAESFWSCRVAESIQEAQWVRSKLRETFPVIEGADPLSVEWCTYNGIVRGKTPIELGVSTHMSTPAAVLHKRKDVDSILADIQEFWRDQEIDESDPALASLVSKIKIENPWRQISQYELRVDFELEYQTQASSTQLRERN